VVVLSIGPLLFAVGLFVLTYLILRWRLWRLEKKHINGIDYYRIHRSELETTVRPTSPVEKGHKDG
jgi:hypothetical protein